MSANPTVLCELRSGTRDAHRALEQQPLLQALFSPALTQATYVALLQALHAYYRVLEPALRPGLEALWRSCPAPPGYCYTAREPVLRRDLEQLGDRPAGEAAASVVTVGECAGSALGVLYVLEGATQGGRVISARVARQLALADGRGLGYFGLNLEAEPGSWVLFRRWLDEPALQDLAPPAVASARATFAGLHAHLDRWRINTTGLTGPLTSQEAHRQ